MAGESSDLYERILARDNDESVRLNAQHGLFSRAFGYQVHPKIAAGLSEHAKIAEIATGTTVWIQEMCKTMPKTCEYHAFDLSDALFPPAESLPANVKLHVHDTKKPYPDEFKGQFDLVNIELLVLVLEDHEWEGVLQNVMELLKPAKDGEAYGGALQWTEVNVGQLAIPLRARPESLVSALAAAHTLPSSMRPRYQYKKFAELPLMFQDARLKDVGVDIVSTDRIPEERREYTEQIIGAMDRIWAAARKANVPNAITEEQSKELVRRMVGDMESGSYYRIDLHKTIGFR